MTISVQSSVAGTLTDTIDVASQGFSSLTTFTSVQVTNSVPTSADLSVSINPPPFGALVHDYVTYGVTVKNLGSAVTNVVLSNSIPAGVKLISVSPENSSATLININSLTNGASRTFQFTIEPTNSGVLTLSASASVAGLSETNNADNVATTNLTVGDLVFGQLTATSLSAMELDRQTGLMEQTIRVSNVSTSDVSSARVIVTGLAKSNLVFNAVGTNTLGSNAPNPFVVYTGKLEAGASVDLLMEYFSPARAPFDLPDSDFVAVGGPSVNLSTTNSPAPNILRSVFLGDKGFFIEFDAILNRSYSIIYSDNVNFSNALIAQPPIIAHANHVQWIDDGPPKTISEPTNSMRFYRVLLNP
ncbi:MAG TPA: hypothetical protein VFM25_06510 [Verrucomicrobiae bacterium]|nr:hypothetical protein [Verrucomicrobiae bacterium]